MTCSFLTILFLISSRRESHSWPVLIVMQGAASILSEKNGPLSTSSSVSSLGLWGRGKEPRQQVEGLRGFFFGTTVNVQTIYPNKSCSVKGTKRHEIQMNKKHQLPGPDLERPGPKHTFHTKWLQIGSDKPAAERRALTRLPTKHFSGPGHTEEGGRRWRLRWEVKELGMKVHHNWCEFTLKWDKMAQFEHLVWQNRCQWDVGEPPKWTEMSVWVGATAGQCQGDKKCLNYVSF